MRERTGETSMLVTGASGLLGATFVSAAAQTHDVVACYGRHAFAWPGTRVCASDFTDPVATGSILDRFQPAVVVHLAAATNLDRCEAFPAEAHALNVDATATIAQWCAKSGAQLVYMSTDSVFDGVTGGYDEKDAPAPVNVYAHSKLAGERVIQKSGCRHLIVRANIFGWNAQPKQSLSEWILGRLDAGQIVPGFTDVIFNPLNVATLSEIFLSLLQRDAQGVVHVGSASPLSKYEFAQQIATEFGYPTNRIEPTSLAQSALKVRRPLNTSLRCRRLHDEFGIEPPAIASEIGRFHQSRRDGFPHRIQSALQSV